MSYKIIIYTQIKVIDLPNDMLKYLCSTVRIIITKCIIKLKLDTYRVITSSCESYRQLIFKVITISIQYVVSAKKRV